MARQPQEGQAPDRHRQGTADTAPGPEVDLRVVLLTRDQDRLLVALTGREPGEASAHAIGLPRGRPELGQDLDDTARGVARRATSLSEQYLEQLYTMSVDQSTRGSWKVVVGYMALLSSGPEQAPGVSGTWANVDHLPAVSRIDRSVIDYAVIRLRAKLGYTNIGRYLLPQTFTLRELQSVYETVLGQPLDKRNFRRRMLATGILAPTDGQRRDGSHRPAALYRFQAEEDRTTYLTPTWTDSGDTRRTQDAVD